MRLLRGGFIHVSPTDQVSPAGSLYLPRGALWAVDRRDLKRILWPSSKTVSTNLLIVLTGLMINLGERIRRNAMKALILWAASFCWQCFSQASSFHG